MACPPLAATPKQPSMGSSGMTSRPSLDFGADQGGGSLLGVHLPLRHGGLGQLAHVIGIHHVGRHRRMTKPVAAVGPDLLQVHRQGIARLGPLHVKGPGLRVTRGGHLPAVAVEPPRVHRSGHEGIAVPHPQYRQVRSQGGVVSGGSEVVLHGLGLRFRTLRQLRRNRPSASSPAERFFRMPARTQDRSGLKVPFGSARQGLAPGKAWPAQSPTGLSCRPTHRPAETNRYRRTRPCCGSTAAGWPAPAWRRS